jgi:hypothetical protein
MDRVERIADCGTVYPERHTAAHPHDPCVMQTRCLALATPDACLSVRVRFGHPVQRTAARITENGREPVDELSVGGERYVTGEEGTQREILVPQLLFGGRSAEQTRVHIPGGEEREVLYGADARPAGMLTQSWCALSGSVDVESEPLGSDLFQITVEITNRSTFDGGERERALRSAFCSTHVIMRIERGELLAQDDLLAARS